MTLALALSGCGDAGRRSPATVATAATGKSSSPESPPGAATSLAQTAPPKGDDDNEGDLTGRDSDDASLFDYGHRAPVGDARAVGALLKRYYAAAGAANGARVCSLLYSPVAESVAEDYGQPPAPVSTRGSTCPEVMAKVYRGARQHRFMTVRGAALRVRQLRVRGNQGIALLYFGHGAERYIYVRREFGSWKVKVFYDIGIT
jgi:hypothetical protein